MNNPLRTAGSDSFGDWLRWRRKSFDWTQAMLAQRAACTAAMIRKIEADERKPSQQLAELLATALGVPEEDRPDFLLAARQGQAVRSLSAPSFYPVLHNLPVPMTSLVDRVRDAAIVARLLARADVRLLTLLGPPGIGKTRLAIHTAATLAGHFRDGIWFVDLAAVTDATLVLPAIAYVLAVAEVGATPLLTRLRTTLAQKELLLLLDNFEQVSAAALEVAELLHSCKGLKVLATSRTPLLLAGEHEYALPPLSLPPPELILDNLAADELPEILLAYEAVQLFVARVRQHQHDFSVTPANAVLVSNLTLRLDGIPLAIELAAATLRRMTLSQLATMLHDEESGLHQLRSPARDLPTRQQTLTNAVAWSCSLLDTETQTVFRQLGIFVGGFTADAAQAVCTADYAMLAHLTDHSLLVRTPEGWRMLEMIREFALAQMSSAESKATQRRHIAYFMTQPTTNLTTVARDHANLRTALAAAITTDDTHAALTLCLKLSWFWEMHGLLREGMTLARAALSMPDGEDARLRMDVLERVSTLSWQVHQFEVALHYAEQIAALADRIGGPEDQAIARNLLGRIFIEQGDYTRAEVALQEALYFARQSPHRYNLGCPLAQLGELALARGEWEAAQAHLEQAIRLLSADGKSFYTTIHLAIAHTNLAEYALAHGNPIQTRHELQQVLPYAHLYMRRLHCLLVTLAGLLLSPANRVPKAEAHAAAEFLGACAGVSARTGDTLSPLHQALIAQRSGRAQRFLDPHEWQTAWQAGYTWKVAQVVSAAERWLKMEDGG